MEAHRPLSQVAVIGEKMVLAQAITSGIDMVWQALKNVKRPASVYLCGDAHTSRTHPPLITRMPWSLRMVLAMCTRTVPPKTTMRHHRYIPPTPSSHRTQRQPIGRPPLLPIGRPPLPPEPSGSDWRKGGAGAGNNEWGVASLEECQAICLSLSLWGCAYISYYMGAWYVHTDCTTKDSDASSQMYTAYSLKTSSA